MDAVVKGLAALLFCAAVALACCGIVADSTPTEQHAQEVSTVDDGHLLTLDTSNNALMHRYGMPTKADCMEWHIHGQWGWMDGGKLYAFDQLPGDSRAWDELYGIDGDNKAFDK